MNPPFVFGYITKLVIYKSIVWRGYYLFAHYLKGKKAVRCTAMDITEIRYKNARYLADSVGGINAVAEKMGKSQPQISHLLADKPVKNIGNKIARQFEVAFNKPKDWLDHSHPELWGELPKQEEQQEEELTAEAVEFAKLWQELPPEQRAVLESTAKAFIYSTQKQTSKVA